MKVTKWSIFNGELTVSEHEAGQTSGEVGSLSAGISHSADGVSDTAPAGVAEAVHGSADAAEKTGAPDMSAADAVSEPLTSEAAKADVSAAASQPEAIKLEATKPEATEPDATKPDISHTPGKVTIMPRGDRAWADRDGDSEPAAAQHQNVFGKRRIAAIAAVAALAAVAGALGGAFATATFAHGGNDVAMNGSQTSLEASLSRIDGEIQALKAGLDHTSKLGMNQFNKTSDRLDKFERAQAEPAAKLAKLNEAVDKLRAAPALVAAALTASASKETTGSIAPAQQAAATPAVSKTEAKTDAKADVKVEVGRLPTLDDWTLRDVGYGGALIGSRRGVYEVYAGDVIPGLGRVDAIRRQDGRWVVVTSRGLIVARR
jgi:hypothetical protein